MPSQIQQRASFSKHPLTCRTTSDSLGSDTFRRHISIHRESKTHSRVAQACLPCYRAKTGCDGNQPSCATCQNKGRLCEWPQPRKQDLNESEDCNQPIGFQGSAVSQTQQQEPVLEARPPTPPTAASYQTDSNPPMSGFLPAAQAQKRLVTAYFDHFHSQWPVLHRESFLTSSAPKVLLQSVSIIGLWFILPPASRSKAEVCHDQLLKETGNDLVSVPTQVCSFHLSMFHLTVCFP